MLNTFARAVGSLFCDHEWTRRREPGRLYLECLRCLATTSGVAVKQRRPDQEAAARRPHLAHAKV
jgi:hypothetical protein